MWPATRSTQSPCFACSRGSFADAPALPVGVRCGPSGCSQEDGSQEDEPIVFLKSKLPPKAKRAPEPEFVEAPERDLFDAAGRALEQARELMTSLVNYVGIFIVVVAAGVYYMPSEEELKLQEVVKSHVPAGLGLRPLLGVSDVGEQQAVAEEATAQGPRRSKRKKRRGLKARCVNTPTKVALLGKKTRGTPRHPMQSPGYGLLDKENTPVAARLQHSSARRGLSLRM
jgi:hypothetical protein